MPKKKQLTPAVRDYMASIGAKGGKIKGGLKALKVRENGKLGGRPRKKISKSVDNKT